MTRVLLSPALVVAAWGGLNGLLTAFLAVSGETAVPLIVYGCAVALTELVACLVLLRRYPSDQPRRWRQPLRPSNALLIAVAALTGGLGLAFGYWLAITSIALFVIVVVRELAALRGST